jgi:hypothetical protein
MSKSLLSDLDEKRREQKRGEGNCARIADISDKRRITGGCTHEEKIAKTMRTAPLVAGIHQRQRGGKSETWVICNSSSTSNEVNLMTICKDFDQFGSPTARSSVCAFIITAEAN